MSTRRHTDDVERALEAVRRQRPIKERAEANAQKELDALYATVRAAVEAGAPIARVARESGLSRQGIYNVIGDKRGRRR